MSLRRDQPVLEMMGAILDAILAFSGSDDLGTTGADLEAAVGDLRTSAQASLRSGGLHSRLLDCFVLARQTGMAFDTVERLRTTIAALGANDPRSVIVQTYSVAFCCIQEAAIVADTIFTSRNEVDRVAGLLATAFNASQDAMATNGDTATYRALVGLRAVVIRDLADRARPLPQLVTYAEAVSFSSLVMAQRLYGDAGRADEIVAENAVVHPLFMPLTGRALSA